MPPGEEPPLFRLLLGRAFLVAVGREDRDTLIAFARALLTQFPPPGPHGP